MPLLPSLSTACRCFLASRSACSAAYLASSCLNFASSTPCNASCLFASVSSFAASADFHCATALLAPCWRTTFAAAEQDAKPGAGWHWLQYASFPLQLQPVWQHVAPVQPEPPHCASWPAHSGLNDGCFACCKAFLLAQ